VTFYSFLLALHSLVRWAIVLLVVALLARSIHGWVRGRPWDRADERAHLWLVGVVDLQFVLGLLLYLKASPIVRSFLDAPGPAMKVTELRFFGLEHPVTMLAAVVVIHVGRVRSRSGPRHRRAAVWTIAALVLLFAGIPWPFLRHGRPLARSPIVASESAGQCPSTYEDRCVSCHGSKGRGDGTASMSLHPPPRDFTSSVWQASHDDASISAVIHDGGAAHGLSPSMASQRDLTQTELDDLVRCVRSFHDPAR
jgi:hypothetical protein